MARSIAVSLLALVLVACAGGPAPAAVPADSPERFRCDRLAARAIQAADPAEAGALASQASGCYAALPSAP